MINFRFYFDRDNNVAVLEQLGPLYKRSFVKHIVCMVATSTEYSEEHPRFSVCGKANSIMFFGETVAVIE